VTRWRLGGLLEAEPEHQDYSSGIRTGNLPLCSPEHGSCLGGQKPLPASTTSGQLAASRKTPNSPVSRAARDRWFCSRLRGASPVRGGRPTRVREFAQRGHGDCRAGLACAEPISMRSSTGRGHRASGEDDVLPQRARNEAVKAGSRRRVARHARDRNRLAGGGMRSRSRR